MTIGATGSDLWLVGAGRMARDYVSVLDSLNVDYEVVGRGKDSSTAFEVATGRTVLTGGITRAIGNGIVPDRAIVAVGVEELAEVAYELLDAGVTRLLLEKPGGLCSEELVKIRGRASSAEVIVAYNRRHYMSTSTARQMISDDGGVTSFFFEVTEWPNATEPEQVKSSVRQRWFLAQSSHVVDLAFHLGGHPINWASWNGGSLPWHPESSRFAGAGTTNTGATFGFHGDWEAPGRWGLELMTRSRRLIFRPLETLQVLSIGSLEVVPVPIDDQIDRDFKPGLYEQTRSFLLEENGVACTLDEQIENMHMYEQIAGYR